MKNISKKINLIQNSSADGGFLQSKYWLEFQEKLGRVTFRNEKENFVANCITHTLPVVGLYWYIPRGPIFSEGKPIKQEMRNLVLSSKQKNIGWIRIEPANEIILNEIRNSIYNKIVKAPHDTQPREIFVVDISKAENEILSQMKQKTRYNIALAKKKGVVIKSCNKTSSECQSMQEVFLQLTKEMAIRQGIATHPENYYRKMIELLPENMLRIYAAEYNGKIIAANLVLHFGKFATYLHGASSNQDRNVMAPYLLQWQSIVDAKEDGCEKYDFGGVKTGSENNSWAGITNFKLGFSQIDKTISFPGTYDIVVNPRKYGMYRGLQKAKMFVKQFKK